MERRYEMASVMGSPCRVPGMGGGSEGKSSFLLPQALTPTPTFLALSFIGLFFWAWATLYLFCCFLNPKNTDADPSVSLLLAWSPAPPELPQVHGSGLSQRQSHIGLGQAGQSGKCRALLSQVGLY